MRNLKKLLAVVVAICVLATFSMPAFADEKAKTDTEYLEKLSLIKGDGNGVNADYLAKGTSRIQAAILFLRLLGLEDKALKFSSKENFADADSLTWEEHGKILQYSVI